MLSAETEYWTKMVICPGSVRLAAIGLQEAKKEPTEIASLKAKENIEEARMLDEAHTKSMQKGYGSDWGGAGRDAENQSNESRRRKVQAVLIMALTAKGAQETMKGTQHHRNDAGIGPGGTTARKRYGSVSYVGALGGTIGQRRGTKSHAPLQRGNNSSGGVAGDCNALVGCPLSVLLKFLF